MVVLLVLIGAVPSNCQEREREGKMRVLPSKTNMVNIGTAECSTFTPTCLQINLCTTQVTILDYICCSLGIYNPIHIYIYIYINPANLLADQLVHLRLMSVSLRLRHPPGAGQEGAAMREEGLAFRAEG